jgi:hypothetical protein
MNHAAIEQQLSSLTPPSEEYLATPHFDDSAVATAHQVQPLPKRPAHRFESSQRVIVIAAAVVAGIVLGIASVVISSRATDQGPSVAPASAQMDSLDQASAIAEMTDSTVMAEQLRTRPSHVSHASQTHPRRTTGRYMAEEFSDNDDYSLRQSARKVGVIYYGRSRGYQY